MRRRLGALAAFVALVSVFLFQSVADAALVPRIRGEEWLGGKGVPACDAGTDKVCDDQEAVGGVSYNWWQCVELAQRLYKTRGWHTGVFSGVGSAWQIYTQAENGNLDDMQAIPNGDITTIVPGDMIVHRGGPDGDGHVAVVDTVVGGTVNVVEQNNPPGKAGRGTYTWSSGTLTRSGHAGLPIMGVVHDADNVSPYTLPGPVRNLTARGDSDGLHVTLRWLPPLDTGGGPVDYVVTKVYEPPYGPSTKTQVTAATTITIGAAAGRDPYSYVTVAARNPAGTGPAVRPSKVLDIPAAPSNVRFDTFYGFLTWTDNSSNEDGFHVYQNDRVIATLPANSTEHRGTAVIQCGDVLRVSAFNSAGESERAGDVRIC
jgi:hypothetical protein